MSRPISSFFQHFKYFGKFSRYDEYVYMNKENEKGKQLNVYSPATRLLPHTLHHVLPGEKKKKKNVDQCGGQGVASCTFRQPGNPILASREL